jgi:hypothetical protein
LFFFRKRDKGNEWIKIFDLNSTIRRLYQININDIYMYNKF